MARGVDSPFWFGEIVNTIALKSVKAIRFIGENIETLCELLTFYVISARGFFCAEITQA